MKETEDSEKVEAPPGFERFLRLGMLIESDTKALMVRLLHLIRGNGIYKMIPSRENRESYQEFVAAVHDGWKLAQKLIVIKVCKNLSQISSLEAQKNELHIKKDSIGKSKKLEEIKRLNLENNMLRRFVDSIVWNMLFDEQSTIRRLPMNKHGDNLSVKNIEDIQEVIDQYNECPMTIAVMADLTTFVHHGDVALRNSQGTSFIEVKSGSKSKELLHVMESSERLDCILAETILTKDFTKSEKQQYKRIKKQADRARNLSSTLKLNEGYDQLTGRKVTIKEVKCDIKYYNDELLGCRKRLEDNGKYAISVIDSCLYIGMYKKPESAYLGFSSWMNVLKCSNPIYNLTDSFFDALARPLPSLNMPTEFLEEIITGKIIVMGCLNTNDFYELSRKLYPSMITLKRPSNKADMGEMHVGGEAMAMAMGDQGIQGYLGDGLLNRIRFDLQTPSSILEHQYATTNKYYYIPLPQQKLSDLAE
ncbi:hypothetical protein [Pseudomonas sp. URMO17WK12:I11]|uniref:hypothetical protein n=1 Tax=Pseudomonas sp. URMO17WK12:I11 TaxID=1283291 RepID=UPI0011AB1698|nr:hypothetical protein [Pseudomonas sp. URMO17WK12:I11]